LSIYTNYPIKQSSNPNKSIKSNIKRKSKRQIAISLKKLEDHERRPLLQRSTRKRSKGSVSNSVIEGELMDEEEKEEFLLLRIE